MITAPRFQHFSSGGLALLVHGMFFVALMIGVSWKTLPQLPVEADLWSALPEPPPPPEPEPEPLAPPTPPPPAPMVAAKVEKVDIALEQEKKRRAEESKKAELAHQEELKRQAEEQVRLEKERLEKARLDKEREDRERLEQAQEKERKEKAKREQQRQMEQEMARQAQEELAAEEAEIRARQERANAARRTSTVNDFKRRIQVKIQSYVRLPPKLSGNPEAVFRVTLLPNGEVRRVTLMQSSGQPAYDVEVERAILRASPLPLPNDKQIAASFRDDLILKFHPFEDGGRVY